MNRLIATPLDSGLFRDLADRAIELQSPNRQEALAVRGVSDSETLSLVAEVARVRRHFFQDRVKLNFLLNIKSGLCPEDCHYCSQSKLSTAPIPRYSMLPLSCCSAGLPSTISGLSPPSYMHSSAAPSQNKMR